jgi:hypothetical protein
MTNELNVRAVAVGAIPSQSTTVTRTALNPQVVSLSSGTERSLCENREHRPVTDFEFLEDVMSEWWRTKIATSPTDSGIRPFQMEERRRRFSKQYQLAGDAVLIAPVSNQTPCKQGIFQGTWRSSP